MQVLPVHRRIVKKQAGRKGITSQAQPYLVHNRKSGLDSVEPCKRKLPTQDLPENQAKAVHVGGPVVGPMTDYLPKKQGGQQTQRRRQLVQLEP